MRERWRGRSFPLCALEMEIGEKGDSFQGSLLCGGIGGVEGDKEKREMRGVSVKFFGGVSMFAEGRKEGEG